MKLLSWLASLLLVLDGAQVGAAVICIHEHELRPDVHVQQYENEVSAALQKMNIPGLSRAYHLKGFKGERKGRYAVLWVFESPEAIEDNFGTPAHPRWPTDWLFYENEILAKHLTCHPDAIFFTDYQIVTDQDYTAD
jgi:hypothetical protein